MTEFIITCRSELMPDGSYKVERYKELVRCEDCARYPDCCRPPRDDPKWFCADGKKREACQ